MCLFFWGTIVCEYFLEEALQLRQNNKKNTQAPRLQADKIIE